MKHRTGGLKVPLMPSAGARMCCIIIYKNDKIWCQQLFIKFHIILHMQTLENEECNYAGDFKTDMTLIFYDSMGGL